MGEQLSADDVVAMLRSKCEEAGGQGRFGEKHQVSAPYLSDVINRRRDPGEKVLEALGLERVVTYKVKNHG